MSTHQPPRATAAPTSDGGAPDARQLRAILVTVSVALMAVVASLSGLNVAQASPRPRSPSHWGRMPHA